MNPERLAAAGPPPQDAGEVDSARNGRPCRDSQRIFEAEGTLWVARLAGSGVAGTGGCGLGLLEALHFRPSDQPDTVPLEALVERGRLADLFDDELRELLARARPAARPQVSPDSAPPPAERGGRSRRGRNRR